MPKLTYKFDWNTIKENARNQHQQDANIGSVKDAIMNAVKKGSMADPYIKYKEMQGNAAEAPLHASRGKKLQLEEHRNVLEIDVGGSGFKQMMAAQSGFFGKSNMIEDDTKVSMKDINKGNIRKIHWWNKSSLLQLLPDFLRPKSVEEINKENDMIEKYGRNVVGNTRKKDQQSKADYLFEQKYGKNSTVDGLKDKKYIYVKEEPLVAAGKNDIRRTRYTMPGPLGTILGFGAGARNKGTYSINNLSNYMLAAAKDYMKPIIEEWKKHEGDAIAAARGDLDPKSTMEQRLKEADEIRKKINPVTISLKGHSRGGVAVSHGAMKIKEWLHQEYPQFEKYVQFDLLQLDPVAGYGSDHGVKRNINLQDENRPELKQELKERQMRTLGDSGNSTVVYSLHTDHDHWFSPQIVDGAKRIILMPEKHSVYMKNVDTSQAGLSQGKDQPLDKNHRQAFMDTSTGEMYRSSGLNELPEGIYLADENNRLIRIPDLQTGREILHDILKDTSGQEGRHNRLDEVMENWFSSHSKEFNATRTLNRAKTNIKELESTLKTQKEERRSLAPKQEPQLSMEQPEKKRSMSMRH